MKIASGGIQHETNTFAVTPTTLADFERDSQCGPDFSGGEAIVSRYRNTGTIHGGYIAGAEQAGFELAPLVCAKAQPSGIVRQDAFDTLLRMFLERLQSCGPVDGILLDLHGAMVTEAHDDAEGAYVQAVRSFVGQGLPIVVTLDLHANITPQLAALSNVIIGFDTYPHVDMFERGREAALLMSRMVRGEVLPVQAYRQLPLITLPPMQCTLREPMQSFIERMHRLEQRDRILTATVSMGFPFADIADAGCSVLVTADGDEELAAEAANELARDLWNLRDDLQPQLTTIQDAVAWCESHDAGPVIFADGSDNPGGGAPCDGTVALRYLLGCGFQGAVVGILYDPETAAQAHSAGVGETIDVRLGGKTDDKHGAPIETKAYVRSLCDGRFVHHGPMRQGLTGDFGPMAALEIGGVDVVVATHRTQLLDREMLRIAGVTPEHKRLIVVKSAVHFRADFGPMAARIFDADTPGIHRPDFANYDYRKLRRPIYPLDSEVKFQ